MKQNCASNVVRYKLFACGNDSVACQAAPLDGPLNQFGKRTLVDLRHGDVVVKVEDVQKLIVQAERQERAKLRRVLRDLAQFTEANEMFIAGYHAALDDVREAMEGKPYGKP